MALDASLLSKYYKVRIQVKWSNPEKGVAPWTTERCCSC